LKNDDDKNNNNNIINNSNENNSSGKEAVYGPNQPLPPSQRRPLTRSIKYGMLQSKQPQSTDTW
jgi:hypothetical protein